MGRIALVMLATIACGCPRSTGSSTAASPTAALTIPPGPGTLDAVRALDAAGEAGDVHAAWDRAHYLLDLFDDARFRGADDSRAMLWQALGETPEHPRGPEATDRAVAALIGEVEEVLALDRMHRGASAARIMLELDRAPRDGDGLALRRALELKAAARVESVTGNGVLRLAGYCIHALDDATRGATRDRARALSHCLYPLYEADPAPYFAGPSERPPLPRWQDLVNETGRLIDTALPRVDRLRPALEQLRASLDALRKQRADELPAEPDPAALSLPAVDHAEPYDFTPLATGDASVVGPLEGDGRGVLALPLAESAPRADLDRALTGARAAGAGAVDVLVSITQTLEIPPADYWAQRGGSTTVQRAGAVRIALSTAPPDDDSPTLGPRKPLWDPTAARLGLYLVIEKDRWRVTSATGDAVSIKAHAPQGDPRTELRVALARIQAAFPDEAALVIVLGPGAGYADLVRAASAAARDDRGRPLFPHLAFGEAAPAATESTLARRVERRWQATVSIVPAELANHTGAIRRCYQDALESHPELRARLIVDSGAATAEPASAAAQKVADCAARALPDERADVTLAPR